MNILLKPYNNKLTKKIILSSRVGLNDDPDTNKTISIILLSNFSPFILDARSELKMYKGHRDKGKAERKDQGWEVGVVVGQKWRQLYLNNRKRKKRTVSGFGRNMCV